MKKIIILLVLALVCSGGIFAQSLQDNENYKKSLEETRLSEQALQFGDFDAARDHAIKAQEYAALYRREMDARMGISSGEKAATYRVKKNDCLWRIAAMDFIYGDAYKWQQIYEANKSRFHDPENPHLIFAGQVFTIPSLAGEGRSGER